MKISLLEIAVIAILQINAVYSATLTCNSTAPPCTYPSITPVTSANEIITVAGQSANYIDPTTTSLSFDTPNVLNFIPTKLFTTFPNIQSFYLSNVSLTNVVSNAFGNCGNLNYIYVNNNNFPTLPANFASTCINVTSLQVGSNNIQSIDADALKGLTLLTSFNAYGNKFTCIPPTLFKNTPFINYIDFGQNHISEIHADTFKNLPSLTNVNLQDNRIINLPAFNLTGSSLTSMRSFQFNLNPINSISPKFISNIFANPFATMYNYVNFYTNVPNVTTCIPNNYNVQSISNNNWPLANYSLTPCYANWNDSYQTSLSCAPNYTVETTTTNVIVTTTNNGLETTTKKVDNGNQSCNSCIPLVGKNFFSIITNYVKNFTASVTFY